MMANPNTPVVYVVDDDLAVRESLRELLVATHRKVVCFDSAMCFLRSFDASLPGCLILDVRMPEMSGIQLQEQLQSQGVRIPVIIFTGHGDVPMSVKAMKQGAIDFFEKPYRPQELRDAVDHALALAVEWHQEESRKNDLEELFGRLTQEERSVMDGIVAGKTNQQIASQLDISLRTVQFRRTTLMKKLNIDGKADLVQLANKARPAVL